MASNYEQLVKALRYCGNFAEREGCAESCEYFNDMDCPNRIMSDAAAAIEDLQAQLPKRGGWKPFDLTWGRSIYSCTVCGESADVPTANGKALYNYCPNCGAKMEVQDGQE